MEHIIKLIGEPTLMWPKHRGHLKHSDRFHLVAFLACNGVPEMFIKRLRDDNSIFLKDKKAKSNWDDTAEQLSRNEDKRRKYYAYNLKQARRVPIAEACNNSPQAEQSSQAQHSPLCKRRKIDFFLD